MSMSLGKSENRQNNFNSHNEYKRLILTKMEGYMQ